MIDLSTRLLGLLGPARVGDEVVPGVRLVAASTELGIRWTFEQDGQRIYIELIPTREGARHAARTPRLLLSYRLPPNARHDAAQVQAGLALCKQLVPIVARHEDSVLDALAADARGVPVDLVDTARVREVRGGPLLALAGSSTQRFLTLSPYVGCLIGCRFCYAQSRVSVGRALLGLPDLRWGSFVDARVDAPEVLARELVELDRGAGARLPIKFCPIVSDPYQAIEARLRLTQQCLEVLAAAPPRPVLVLTRAALITRDTALLGRLPDVRAGVSLPTIDDSVRRHFEPRAASIAQRLDALRTLRAVGVRTFAVVQPMLPGDVHALADAIAGACSSASLDVLRGEEGATADFDDPRYASARAEPWQQERRETLRQALLDRGVSLFEDELPGE
jgi:DNA repair photolyase